MTILIFEDIQQNQMRYGIFDFDNGIVDTEAVFAAFDRALLNDVLRQAGLAGDLTLAYMRDLAGHSGSEKLKIIARAKGFSADDFLDAFNETRTAQRQTLFRDKPASMARGLEALLGHLGERTALATNKKEAKLIPDMENMGISALFDIVVTSDGLNKKPAPDVIIKAMGRLGAAAEQSVYFGDNVTDIEAARAANTCAIGFIIEGLAGHESRIEAMKQVGAHAITDNYEDMIPYF